MEIKELENRILEKINAQIEEMKISMNKKEDDLKNLINEKENIIQELNYKIIKHENILKNYHNKINNLTIIIENIVNKLDNKIKEKDFKINEIEQFLYNQNIQIKEIGNSLNKEINNINNKFYIKDNNNNKDDLIKNYETIINKFMRINDKNIYLKDILIEINQKIQNSLINEKINKYAWINLIYNDIPTNLIIKNVRLFYYFFNNLYKNMNISSNALNYIKYLYFNLLKISLKGGMPEFLSENIKTSNKSILKLIKYPLKFFKEEIYIYKFGNDIIDETINIILYFIDKIPDMINQIKEKVNRLEEFYKEKEIDERIQQIYSIFDNYNKAIHRLKILDDKNIAFEVQIHPKDIYEYEEMKKKIQNYKDLYTENENETVIFWRIPFRNIDINIKYNDKDIQIFRGKNNFLYFIIDNLDDEFKHKFSVFEQKNKNKMYKKRTKENQDEINIERELPVEHYIYFDKAEKIIAKSISGFENREEFNDKISKIEKIYYPKVLFNKGKTFKDLSSEINKLKEHLSKIIKTLEGISLGNIEKKNIKELIYLIKNYFNISYNLIHDFDVEDNLSDVCGYLDKILEIKKNFFEYHFSMLENNLKKLYDLRYNLERKEYQNILDTIINTSFNIPILPEKKIYNINYDNIILNSPFLSLPILTKINDVLKCNYNKICIQKGPFYPDFYSKPMILNIL